jgi:hypothetical protein
MPHFSRSTPIDLQKTFFSYESRLRSFSPRRFQRLKKLHQPLYLSSYETYGTDFKDRANHHRGCSSVYVLMRVMREMGVPVKAVTSERKRNGKYIADLLEDDTRENSHVLYVGKYNYFSKQKSSPWRLLPCDKKLSTGEGGR